MTQPTPLYLDASAVAACLPDKEMLDIVRSTMSALGTQEVVVGPTAVFPAIVDGQPVRMGSMSGCMVSRSTAGLKWFYVPAKARAHDAPHVPATIVLCNARTGQLDGVMDATLLTSERTAAMGVVTALACMRKPPQRVVIVGAGHIGRAAAKFFTGIPSISRIDFVSRTLASAEAACVKLSPMLTRPVSLNETTDVREAVREADLVVTATNVSADSDLVRAQWLKSDATVCSLGSAREVDLELVATSWIVIHDVEHVAERRADFREGGAGWGRVAGDVTSLMAGKLQLPAGNQRVYLVVGSIGVLDVALGAQAMANARRKGLGVKLQGPETAS